MRPRVAGAARSHVLDGAGSLIVCADWERPDGEGWRTYLLGRAFESAVLFAAASRVGDEPLYAFTGHRRVVGPRGKVCASVEEPAEGYALARIDVDEVRRQREETQILQRRQRANYRALVSKHGEGPHRLAASPARGERGMISQGG